LTDSSGTPTVRPDFQIINTLPWRAMMKGFGIVKLVVCLGFSFVFSAAAHTSVNGQSTMRRAKQVPPAKQSPTQTAGPIYVESPLSEIGNLTQPKKLADRLVPVSTPKQIVYEIRILTANTDIASEIYGLVDAATIQVGNSQLPVKISALQKNIDQRPQADSTSETGVIESPKPTVQSSTMVVDNPPATTAMIRGEKIQDVIDIVKSKTNASITQAPTITTFDNQTAVLNDMVTRPFVVGVKPITNGNQTAHQPIIQTVEDGFAIQVSGKTTNQGIKTTVDFTRSQILDVETFSFRNQGTEVITIQVPKQKLSQILVNTEIPEGDTLLVDLYGEKSAVPVESKSPMAKLPLLKNLNKKVFKQVEKRVFLLVKPTIIESKEVETNVPAENEITKRSVAPKNTVIKKASHEDSIGDKISVPDGTRLLPAKEPTKIQSERRPEQQHGQVPNGPLKLRPKKSNH